MTLPSRYKTDAFDPEAALIFRLITNTRGLDAEAARSGVLAIALWAAACGSDSTGPGGPTTTCASVSLSAGQSKVVDPASSTGCLLIPATAGAAEYLVVALSASGTVKDGGTTGAYNLTAGAPGAAALIAPSPKLSAFRARQPATEFHQLLRQYEQGLARSPAARFRIGGGSGRHILIEQSPSTGAVQVKLTKHGTAALDAALDARFGVARVR